MKKFYLFISLTLFALIFSGCGNRENKDKKNVIEERGSIQAELLQMYFKVDSLYRNETPDFQLMNDFIAQVYDFTEKFSEESIAPELLFKAGIFAMILAQSLDDKIDIATYARQAIDIFNKIEKVYPEYKDVRNCYLFRGQVYEIIRDYKSAEIEYSDYIYKYPNDSLTIKNLKAYVENLGKSPDEILALLERGK